MTMAPAVLNHDSNGHEWSARWKKAHQLAAFLFAGDFPSADVEFIDEAQWEAVAAHASNHFGEKVNPPNSQDTIQCVVDCLRKLENAHAVVEPFARFPEVD